jgi:signal transduction histidine kinase
VTEKTKSTVVLIDDSLIECKKISQLLISEGFEVTYFDDAFLGLEYITRNLPDIIVSDIIMPGMDGFQVCQYIKSHANIAHIPVILLTGLGSPETFVKGFEAGASDFVNKMEHHKVLVTRIRSCIDYHWTLRQYREMNARLEDIIEQRTQLLIKAERQCIFAQFIQGIIHNLKNPLGAISGFSEVNMHYLDIVIKKYQDKTLDTIKHNNSLIYDSIENIFRIIHSLLKKGKDNMNEKKETINLNDFLKKELSFFEANIFFNNKVKKRFNIQDDDLVISVVPTVISQVFQNLMSNAIDALMNSTEPTIDISTGKDEHACWFAIKDNGSGIDEENLSSLFDAFFSTKNQGNESNQSYSGSGLGLFICKEMIESIHGKIEVNSKKGEFTEFKVTLPLDI